VIELITNPLALGFVAAQGGAVFLTAWLSKRYLNLASPWWKPLLMLLSYFAWIVATGVGYTLIGGSWAMMEGGFFVLALFVSASLSALVFTFVWLVGPFLMKHANG